MEDQSTELLGSMLDRKDYLHTIVNEDEQLLEVSISLEIIVIKFDM